MQFELIAIFSLVNKELVKARLGILQRAVDTKGEKSIGYYIFFIAKYKIFNYFKNSEQEK